MLYNSVERVTSALVSAAMEGYAPFDVQKVFGEITVEDVAQRLACQLRPESMALSVITPTQS